MNYITGGLKPTSSQQDALPDASFSESMRKALMYSNRKYSGIVANSTLNKKQNSASRTVYSINRDNSLEALKNGSSYFEQYKNSLFIESSDSYQSPTKKRSILFPPSKPSDPQPTSRRSSGRSSAHGSRPSTKGDLDKNFVLSSMSFQTMLDPSTFRYTKHTFDTSNMPTWETTQQAHHYPYGGGDIKKKMAKLENILDTLSQVSLRSNADSSEGDNNNNNSNNDGLNSNNNKNDNNSDVLNNNDNTTNDNDNSNVQKPSSPSQKKNTKQSPRLIISLRIPNQGAMNMALSTPGTKSGRNKTGGTGGDDGDDDDDDGENVNAVVTNHPISRGGGVVRGRSGGGVGGVIQRGGVQRGGGGSIHTKHSYAASDDLSDDI